MLLPRISPPTPFYLRLVLLYCAFLREGGKRGGMTSCKGKSNMDRGFPLNYFKTWYELHNVCICRSSVFICGWHLIIIIVLTGPAFRIMICSIRGRPSDTICSSRSKSQNRLIDFRPGTLIYLPSVEGGLSSRVLVPNWLTTLCACVQACGFHCTHFGTWGPTDLHVFLPFSVFVFQRWAQKSSS